MLKYLKALRYKHVRSTQKTMAAILLGVVFRKRNILPKGLTVFGSWSYKTTYPSEKIHQSVSRSMDSTEQPPIPPLTHPTVQPSRLTNTHPIAYPSKNWRPSIWRTVRPSVDTSLNPSIHPFSHSTSIRSSVSQVRGLSVCPFLHNPSHPSIRPVSQTANHPSIHQSIDPSIDLFIHPVGQSASHPSIDLPVDWSIYQSIYPSINMSQHASLLDGEI